MLVMYFAIIIETSYTNVKIFIVRGTNYECCKILIVIRELPAVGCSSFANKGFLGGLVRVCKSSAMCGGFLNPKCAWKAQGGREKIKTPRKRGYYLIVLRIVFRNHFISTVLIAFTLTVECWFCLGVTSSVVITRSKVSKSEEPCKPNQPK